MAEALTKTSYPDLLADLADILESGRERARVAVAVQLAQTYWQLGSRLSDAPRSVSTLTRLAKDLGLQRSILHDTMALYARYPDGLPDLTLGWSHHRRLLNVADTRTANALAEKAHTSRWTVRQLDQAIKAGATRKPARKSKNLKRPTEPDYVYRAEYIRAVDGDTIILRVDLGFYVRIEQRMRLANVDTPEPGTPEGDTAQAWVHQTLANAGTIAVKTKRVDRYGRYVAHIFYSPREDMEGVDVFAKGKYLNGVLLRKGMGERV